MASLLWYEAKAKHIYYGQNRKREKDSLSTCPYSKSGEQDYQSTRAQAFNAQLGQI